MFPSCLIATRKKQFEDLAKLFFENISKEIENERMKNKLEWKRKSYKSHTPLLEIKRHPLGMYMRFY